MTGEVRKVPIVDNRGPGAGLRLPLGRYLHGPHAAPRGLRTTLEGAPDLQSWVPCTFLDAHAHQTLRAPNGVRPFAGTGQQGDG